ncbi:MAG: hypothetical protein K0S32_2583 [Bacteroidetes bacterium]|jgi:hypothetical protein|nr:hypothetical protein [Bacteroidota bacterium]
MKTSILKLANALFRKDVRSFVEQEHKVEVVRFTTLMTAP